MDFHFFNYYSDIDRYNAAKDKAENLGEEMLVNIEETITKPVRGAVMGILFAALLHFIAQNPHVDIEQFKASVALAAGLDMSIFLVRVFVDRILQILKH